MIIVDTNVVSEPMKTRGSPVVRDWLDRQAAETLYLTSVSLCELLAGIEALPDGKRKEGLVSGLECLIETLFGTRILPLDVSAARVYGGVIGRARVNGSAISMADGQIASIALAQNFTVATRDTKPFLAAGVRVINPWHVLD